MTIKVRITSATRMKTLFQQQMQDFKRNFLFGVPSKVLLFSLCIINIMNPSSFLSESADCETSKFEIYISTNLSFEREIRDMQKIFVLIS